jgi:GH15 family glucan-1,4-alpha-glucosidase
MAYLPIEEHGIIGDLHTAALIGTNGTIDWLCFPRFDSPSVFASILDDEKGGYFSIVPVDGHARTKQLYHPDTNVLITRFLSPGAVGEIVDFMPLDDEEEHQHPHRLIRRVSVVRGTMKFRVECMPAFNYARTPHVVRLHGERGATFHTDDLTLGLATSLPLEQAANGVCSEFTLEQGQSASFSLSVVRGSSSPGRLLSDRLYEELHRGGSPTGAPGFPTVRIMGAGRSRCAAPPSRSS